MVYIIVSSRKILIINFLNTGLGFFSLSFFKGKFE